MGKYLNHLVRIFLSLVIRSIIEIVSLYSWLKVCTYHKSLSLLKSSLSYHNEMSKHVVTIFSVLSHRMYLSVLVLVNLLLYVETQTISSNWPQYSFYLVLQQHKKIHIILRNISDQPFEI